MMNLSPDPPHITVLWLLMGIVSLLMGAVMVGMMI